MAMDIEHLARVIRGSYASFGRLGEFSHIARVYGMALNLNDQMAALMHDIVEDGFIRLDQVSWVLRGSGIPDINAEQIAASIAVLTRREGEPYDQYIDRVSESGDDIAIRVKQLDLMDHLNPYNRHTLKRDKAERYVLALTKLVFDPSEEAS